MKQITKRIDELDYLRGFALLGIILVNVYAIMHVIPDFTQADIAYQKFLDIFIENKFFAIFTFLFGIGFYIFMNRAAQKNKHPYIVYIRRIVLLGIFGYFHMQLQPGEALLIYAVFGVILIPFYRFNRYFNLVSGLLLLLACVVIGEKLIMALAYFILGLATAQFQLIHKFQTLRKQWALLTALFFAFAIGALITLEYYYVLPSFDLYKAAGGTHLQQYPELWNAFHHAIVATSPLLTGFYVLFLLTVLNTRKGRKLLSPLKYYGRMALTNYIGQTLFLYAAGHLFFSQGIHLIHTLILCLMIYCIQIVLSVVWLKYFTLGPLEYIWKLGTYLKPIRLIKK
ncbi:DUF418 domain-containing protein [Staphylococcus sp. EZ-P03]|uniref:DUF418 domain-containing protein n=1 Tax=Staphylococcus sp. EZ-P03 TaxID=2282739 RepID=UPI000DF858FA|nr:DUF418 domain-containing protein [Staphylococcus sp. EZ-P03]